MRGKMNKAHHDIPLLPYQNSIQKPFKGNSNLLGQSRVILELLGASDDDLSVFKNPPGLEQDSLNIQTWPDSGYGELVENNKVCFERRLKELGQLKTNKQQSAGKINSEIRKLTEKKKVLNSVSSSQQLTEEFYRDFLAKRKALANNLTKDTYEIHWQSTPDNDKGNIVAQATGTTEIEAVIRGILDVDNTGYSIHHFLFPTSEPNENLKKKYSWRFMEKTHTDLDSDSALSIVLALQLLNEQESTAQLKSAITSSQLSSYFTTYSFERDKRNKDGSVITGVIKSKRYHTYLNSGCEGTDENSIVRVKLGGEKNQFATKKMHSDEKHLGDIDYVVFNLAMIASHADGIFFTLKIPNSDKYKEERGGTYIYSPRYWNGMLKSGAHNEKSTNWNWYARGELLEALMCEQHNKSSTVFDYQMEKPLASSVKKKPVINGGVFKL